VSTGNQAAVNDESKNPLFPEAWLTHSNGSRPQQRVRPSASLPTDLAGLFMFPAHVDYFRMPRKPSGANTSASAGRQGRIYRARSAERIG
jgi:hypothetical protein